MGDQVPAPNVDAIALESVAMVDIPAVLRPRLRGWNHLGAFPVSMVATVMLVWWSHGLRGDLAALVFGGGVTALLGTSAAFHRVPWPAAWAAWVKRVDHAMIFVSMGCVYTGAWLASLSGHPTTDILLAVVWIGVAAGVTFKLLWIDAPKWLGALAYVLLGLTGVTAIPTLVAVAGIGALVAMLSGALAFVLGATVYALERPDPFPSMFGFHEIFHLLVTIGLGCYFLAFAAYLLPH